jgi:hypothetical protein
MFAIGQCGVAQHMVKSVRFSPDVQKQLQNMADLNVYGGSLSEIVRRFVHEGLERIAQDGLVEKILRDRGLLVQGKRDAIKSVNTKSGAA